MEIKGKISLLPKNLPADIRHYDVFKRVIMTSNIMLYSKGILMKVLSKLYFFILSISCVAFVEAGDFNSKVSYVQVNDEDSIYAVVEFEVLPENQPDCATDPRMTIDIKTEAGKAIFSLVLSAQASGRVVFGKGKGICDLRSTMDSIRYIRQI